MDTIRKLIVEVVNAHNLMPKDGQGTISPYVQVEFNKQCKNTQTVANNLNPVWNETLTFNYDSSSELKLKVYHDNKVCKINRSLFLGQVKLSSTLFVPKGEEVLKQYRLKNTWTGLFSGKTVKYYSKIGVKIYYVDLEDHLVPPSLQENASRSSSPQPLPQMQEHILSSSLSLPSPSEIEEIETRPTPMPEIVEEVPLAPAGSTDQVNPVTSITRKVLRKILRLPKFCSNGFKERLT